MNAMSSPVRPLRAVRAARTSLAAVLFTTFSLACADSPIAPASDDGRAAARFSVGAAGAPDYCAELARVGPVESKGRVSCKDGVVQVDGKALIVTPSQAADLTRILARGLDLAADREAITKYKDRKGNKPALRTKSELLELSTVMPSMMEGDKASFCSFQMYLFDEAAHNFNMSYSMYWGGAVGLIFGLLGGNVSGAVTAAAGGAVLLAADDDLERAMQQSLVTMDATAENMQQAGC